MSTAIQPSQVTQATGDISGVFSATAQLAQAAPIAGAASAVMPLQSAAPEALGGSLAPKESGALDTLATPKTDIAPTILVEGTASNASKIISLRFGEQGSDDMNSEADPKPLNMASGRRGGLSSIRANSTANSTMSATSGGKAGEGVRQDSKTSMKNNTSTSSKAGAMGMSEYAWKSNFGVAVLVGLSLVFGL